MTPGRRFALIVSGLALASATAQASTMYSLGAASGYEILDYGGSGSTNGYNLSGNNTFSGSNFLVGIAGTAAPYYVSEVSGDAAVTQCLQSLNCSTDGINWSPGGVQSSASIDTSLNNAVTAVTSLYSALTGLTPTATYNSQITGNQTFTSSAGNYQTNVIKLNQGVNISSASGAITISGNATDTFIFLVNGAIDTNQSYFNGITLTGGVTASNIIWVEETNQGVTVAANNGDAWYGTILAPTSNIYIDGSNDGSSFYGSLIGGNGVRIDSNATIYDNYAFTEPAAATPEPSSLSLALAGFFLSAVGLARLLRRR